MTEGGILELTDRLKLSLLKNKEVASKLSTVFLTNLLRNEGKHLFIVMTNLEKSPYDVNNSTF